MRMILPALGCLLLAATASADDAPVMREGVSACDLHRAMSDVLPAECLPPGGLTRSAGATRTLTRSVNLMVLFEHNSARLGDGAADLLDAVGDFLTSEVNAGQRFVIVGHTNSLGTDDYNMDLSQRRAATVVGFLVGTKNVDPARLDVVARGESSPLASHAPDDPRQRRVELMKF